jgi:tetratricopeptide (TPR) repeat protein
MNEQTRIKLLAEAKAIENKKDYIVAVEKYREANRLFPECVDIMVGLANCCVRAQDFTTAERLYRQAIDINPKSLDAWFGLGLMHTQVGDNDSAVKAFSTVLGQDPRHDKALCGLGMVCYQTDMKSDAMNYFIRSVNVNIENTTSLMFLLRLAYDLEQFTVSEGILKKYLELHPANLKIMFGVAGIQYKMNKTSEARDNLEKILIFEPENRDAQQLLDRILEEAQVAV